MGTIVNAHLKRPVDGTAITAALVVRAGERLRCLPNIAGRRCVMLEHAIYDMLGRMTADYDGGYWHFYTLSNGGFYMAPDTDKIFRLSCDNMFEGKVGADTAGIIACAMAYSHLSFLNDGECFAIAYHKLSAFIFQRADAGIIRAALD
jgi:hypothetical protein